MSDLRARIKRRLDYAGATPNFAQVRQLEDYFGLLAKWNQQLNLTALDVEPPTDDGVDRLLIEPVMAARNILAADELLVDIGSGGGSPAIPLKIAAPHLRLMMVESHGRKSSFLRDAVRQLALTDVRVANTRFEELQLTPGVEAADLVSIRAVKPERSLVSRMADLLRPGGRVMWFTSASSSQDVLEAADGILSAESGMTLIPNTPSQLLILVRAGA